MPADMRELAGDLAAETAALRDMIGPLDEAGWHAPTPAEGWSIADQISHLAYFDDAAILAATDPGSFARQLEQAVADGELSPDDVAARYRSLSGPELLSWFDASRRRLIDLFADLDPAARLPWFGLPMSAASALTARIMETWAHGQDIADALGVSREPTERLRHIAHIGVRALPFSFAANGLAVPIEPVRVELTGPGGQAWAWGAHDAENRVSGPALDFCLLVTQRRHRDDTALRADGPVAAAWLAIAQAFAGPPGPGRPPASRAQTP
ncbi:MAG TPA: TIGR03084 family metal-binding protein [Streptosporangiaceae bacterium]|nr:TIGR03084 family metal-binding protein [Streptosporangiaceae bacterium]